MKELLVLRGPKHCRTAVSKINLVKFNWKLNHALVFNHHLGWARQFGILWLFVQNFTALLLFIHLERSQTCDCSKNNFGPDSWKSMERIQNAPPLRQSLPFEIYAGQLTERWQLLISCKYTIQFSAVVRQAKQFVLHSDGIYRVVLQVAVTFDYVFVE